MRIPDIPYVVLGLLSGATTASVISTLVVPEMRAKKETPARIASCHAQEGTARLDRRGVYRGCLIPPRVAR